eukprot:CAMPEP_0194049172 /NCGR_PEP_ID=MMETSP0009_2-20130614/29906_1 /TAXON_ID=210454 /ORGANISM="Grammatophora oceanica, Strain CCMP 410" /LENGTH=802 /DNA_ID=CAMNT_0038695257 /DNA_START=147 /DNA_END=2555 /DNA_ORIENTATION=-
MASQRPLPAMERHRRRSSQKILVMAVVLLSSCTPIASGFISSPSPLTRLPSTLAGAFTDTALIAGTDRANELLSEEEQDYYVHGYQPKTRPLDESVQYYASYVVKSLYEKRRKRLIRRRKKRRFLFWKKADDRPLDLPEIMSVGEEKLLGFREKIRALNEQRKNLVRLAGYTASIVTPSFSFLLIGALMQSIIPRYYAQCVQCVASNEVSRSKIMTAMIGLGVSSTLGALFTGLRGSTFWIAGSRANYNVRVKLHRNLLLQEAAFFDGNEVGDLLSRLNNDVNKIGSVISFHVNVVLRQFAQFLFGSVYLLRISPKLALFSFAGIGVVAWISAVYGDFSRALAEKVQDTFAYATSVAETAFSMSSTIRAFDGVSDESEKYEKAQSQALELEEVQAWAYGTHKFISDTLQTILEVALLFGCWRIGRMGGLASEQLTMFLFYTNFVLESSNEVGDQWAKIQSAVGASTSVFDLIRRIPAVRDPPPKQSPPEELVTEPIISMKNMTVTYGAMEVPALQSVDLDIREGDRVAVIGRSGSGKSTMLRTILRFYDPSSGSCNLDGVDLRNLSRHEISHKVSVVDQEPKMFPMTLMENVLYGIEKDTIDPETGEAGYSDKYRDQARSCILKAGLPIHKNNDLNLELDTRVGEGGRALSGGQRQRVAIARALVRRPEVLLLDEPTAALDSESEKMVVEALKSATDVTKTMVMVTHRLGVIRSLNVNRVIVMERGKIAEQGHPEELLKDPNSMYASLAREQSIFSSTTNGISNGSVSVVNGATNGANGGLHDKQTNGASDATNPSIEIRDA